MATEDVALRKRQQIAKASRTMFLWIVGASAIVGASSVLIFVLAQKAIFNEKILAEKGKTISALDHNVGVVDDLKNNLRVLNTDQKLIDLKKTADTEPIQVVLDALPASPNSAALGASLQSSDLLGQPGVTIDSLVIHPIAGVENNTSSDVIIEGASENSIQFDFSVSVDRADVGKLKEILQRLEKSIRTIAVKNVHVDQQGSRLIMSVAGEAYYQPVKQVELTEKEVKP